MLDKLDGARYSGRPGDAGECLIMSTDRLNPRSITVRQASNSRIAVDSAKSHPNLQFPVIRINRFDGSKKQDTKYALRSKATVLDLSLGLALEGTFGSAQFG